MHPIHVMYVSLLLNEYDLCSKGLYWVVFLQMSCCFIYLCYFIFLCCFIFLGGLGTTFYVSYFNAVLIFGILISLNVKILYSPDSENGVGSIDKIYEKISCLLAPEGNEGRSYMTFNSETGMVWAFMGLCVTASLTYCDQGRVEHRDPLWEANLIIHTVIPIALWVNEHIKSRRVERFKARFNYTSFCSIKQRNKHMQIYYKQRTKD